MDYAQIKEAVTEISRIVQAHSGGRPDDAARQAIEAQCTRIEQAGASMGYFAEKLGYIRDHADSLYSARKHRQYTGGAQQLAVWILGDASSIQGQADWFRREEAKKGDDTSKA